MEPRGLTLLEFLIVVAIIGALAALSVGGFGEYRRRAALAEAKNAVLAQIGQARTKTLASESNSAYGVHFEEYKTVLFSGAVYSSSDPANKELKLPPGIRISSGSVDVVFERLTGEVTSLVVITFQIQANLQTAAITINKSGLFE